MNEWDNEPNELQWVDETTSLRCAISRNHGGALCGYVNIPESHSLYGVGYDDIDASCHGGLTYAGASGLDGWWVGFDCAHSGDLSPAYPDVRGIYRNLAYVQNECRELAIRIMVLGSPIGRKLLQ